MWGQFEGEMTLRLGTVSRRRLELLPVVGSSFRMLVDNYIYDCSVTKMENPDKDYRYDFTFSYRRMTDETYCSKCGRKFSR